MAAKDRKRRMRRQLGVRNWEFCVVYVPFVVPSFFAILGELRERQFLIRANLLTGRGGWGLALLHPSLSITQTVDVWFMV